MERVLAGLLEVGTIIACVIIAIGIVLDAMGEITRFGIDMAGRQLDLGIIAFILLPVLRVVVMLVSYLREKDMWIAAVVASVLVIIGLGLSTGIMFPG